MQQVIITMWFVLVLTGSKPQSSECHFCHFPAQTLQPPRLHHSLLPTTLEIRLLSDTGCHELRMKAAQLMVERDFSWNRNTAKTIAKMFQCLTQVDLSHLI